MQEDVFEWITKELTKAKIARWEEDQKGVSTQAVWWIEAYNAAKKELKNAVEQNKS